MHFRLVAVGQVLAPAALVAVHQVHAQANVGAEALVQVGGLLAVAVGADAAGELVLVYLQRCFADLVDDATGLATPEEHRTSATQHVDLLVVEGLAVVLGGVANTVEVHVAEGVEAAQVHVVARAAALGGIEADARDVAHRFAQRTDLLLFHQRIGHRGDGLRNLVRILFHLADACARAEVAIRLALGGIGDDDRYHRLLG